MAQWSIPYGRGTCFVPIGTADREKFAHARFNQARVVYSGGVAQSVQHSLHGHWLPHPSTLTSKAFCFQSGVDLT